MLPSPILLYLLAASWRLARHDAWTDRRLRAHQARRLEALRRHAYVRSAFYRRFHAGRFDLPLDRLPILTKEILAEAFEDVLSLDRHERRRECITSGSTGEVSRVVYDRRAWAAVLASFARARAWAGAPIRPWPPVRTAVVASGCPSHVSGAVGASLDSWWAPTWSLDAGAPLDLLVAQLNTCHPDVLVAYPSTACGLADEQRAGRLRIQPELVISVAEVLSREARERLRQAWSCPVVNQYVVTEMGCLAAECSAQAGLHLQEDLAVVEIVDERNRPVRPGHASDKVLLSVLFNNALPLIRYEISDRVVLADAPCPCARPFRLLERVEGRREELLQLHGSAAKAVTLHPVVLYEVLDALPVRAWSLAADADGIAVRVVDGERTLDDQVITARLAGALRRHAAVAPPIHIEHTTDIARTVSRKRRAAYSEAWVDLAEDSGVATQWP